MRTTFVGLWVGAALLFLCGCNLFSWAQKKPNNYDLPAEKPSPQELVAYMNRNANQVRSINVQDLSLEIHRPLVRLPAVNGTLKCEKSRNFRMELHGPGGGSLEADVGSNEREFWFYVARNDPPYLFHANHADVGRVKLPFPFHPDWIAEAMGMTVIQETQNFQVKMDARNGTVDLIESTNSPQGEPVYKVATLKIREVADKREPQILERKLVDRQGKVICSAVYTEMQQDQSSGAVIPYRIEFDYPAERIKLKMWLQTASVNTAAPAQTAFQRPTYSGVQQYDLARRAVDSYRQPSDIRPTAGAFR